MECWVVFPPALKDLEQLPEDWYMVRSTNCSCKHDRTTKLSYVGYQYAWDCCLRASTCKGCENTKWWWLPVQFGITPTIIHLFLWFLHRHQSKFKLVAQFIICCIWKQWLLVVIRLRMVCTKSSESKLLLLSKRHSTNRQQSCPICIVSQATWM